MPPTKERLAEVSAKLRAIAREEDVMVIGAIVAGTGEDMEPAVFTSLETDWNSMRETSPSDVVFESRGRKEDMEAVENTQLAFIALQIAVRHLSRAMVNAYEKIDQAIIDGAISEPPSKKEEAPE